MMRTRYCSTCETEVPEVDGFCPRGHALSENPDTPLSDELLAEVESAFGTPPPEQRPAPPPPPPQVVESSVPEWKALPVRPVWRRNGAPKRKRFLGLF
jgi:hypothetical protein